MIEFKEIRPISFGLEDVKEFIAFLESLNENLEGGSLPSRFDSKIVLEVKTFGQSSCGGYRLRSGSWEVRHNPGVVFLASRSSSDAAPTLRSRALLLLYTLEIIARSVSLDEDTERRASSQERRLLSYLPLREVVSIVPRRTFAMCDASHDAEEVFGVAASDDGEILAVKSAGGWVNLSGEPVTPPRDAVVVEWGV